jgi:hypothetical protein
MGDLVLFPGVTMPDIEGQAAPINEDMVLMLTRALKQANEGRFLGGIFIYEMRNRGIGYMAEIGDCHYPELTLALRTEALRLEQEFISTLRTVEVDDADHQEPQDES